MNPLEAAIAALNKVVAQSGFSVSVVGNELTLQIGEATIVNPPDFYLSRWGDAISASFVMEKDGIAGFKEQVRLDYNGESGEMAESTSAEGDPLQNALAKLRESVKAEATIRAEIEAQFEGYKSPDEVDAAVKEAVEAALAEAGDGDKLFTKEQLETRITEAAEKAVTEATKVAEETRAVADVRTKKLTEASLIITAERQTKIAEFPVGKDGDGEFEAWLTTLKEGQTTMAQDMENRGVTLSDNLKTALAMMDGTGDTAYQALVTAETGSAPAGGGTPAFGSEGDGPESGGHDSKFTL